MLLVKEHPPCLTKRGTNITDKFTIIISLGAVLMLLQLLTSNVCALILRLRIRQQKSRGTQVSRRMQSLVCLIEWAEIAIGVLIISISLLQRLVVNSKIGQYCIHSSGVLATEGTWLGAMVVC